MPTAVIKPPEYLEEPPAAPAFSIATTFTPSSTALTAAVAPARPIPTTTTSVSIVSSFSFSTVLLAVKEEISSVACLAASSTALIIARLVKVTEVTTSTSKFCASKISAGTFSIAASAIFLVSP